MSCNVRGRVLSLLILLIHNTDEEKTMTTPEMIEQLKARGYNADRRTIYDDIAAINAAGWEILRSTTGKRGYYYASRTFDDAEIGLLMDSLYTCDFLPEGKLQQLIEKLIDMGTHALRRNRSRRNSLLAIQSREHDSRSIYAVDALYRAIGEERMISFLPFHLDWHKRRAFDALEPVRVKPLHMVWYAQNYYVIVARPDGVCVHYRVDRMAELKVLEPAEGFRRRINDEELKSYASHVFGPAAGRPVKLTLRCDKEAADMVYERFGTNVAAYAFRGDHFNIDVSLTPSRELYGWLIANGDRVELLAPDTARRELAAFLRERNMQYES